MQQFETGTTKTIEGPFGPHEAKIECAKCGAFLAWKPKKTAYVHDNANMPPKERITPQEAAAVVGVQDDIVLMRLLQLTDFDQSFLKTIEKYGITERTTRKQYDLFMKMRKKYLNKEGWQAPAPKPAAVAVSSDDESFPF